MQKILTPNSSSVRYTFFYSSIRTQLQSTNSGQCRIYFVFVLDLTLHRNERWRKFLAPNEEYLTFRNVWIVLNVHGFWNHSSHSFSVIVGRVASWYRRSRILRRVASSLRNQFCKIVATLVQQLTWQCLGTHSTTISVNCRRASTERGRWPGGTIRYRTY